MSARRIIWGRETRALWLTWTAWATLAGFLAASALLLTFTLRAGEGAFWRAEALWAMVAAIGTPVLAALASMRLFAGERQAGTLETLLTAPVSDHDLLVGKYASALGFVWLILAASALPLSLLSHLSTGAVRLNRTALAGSALFLALHAASWTALGTLCSAAARRPTAAAAGTLLSGGGAIGAANLCLLFLPGLRARVPLPPPLLELPDFVSGRLPLASFVIHVALTAGLLFAALRVLEARRWR